MGKRIRGDVELVYIGLLSMNLSRLTFRSSNVSMVSQIDSELQGEAQRT